ncbi:MAG: acyltransferase [Betaproteobacteria bacterium]|nr:acyltransferase [Betaproteobacteria bacterium]
MSAVVATPVAAWTAPAESVRSEVGQIPAVEGLRGVAVLWVMVFHYVVLRDGMPGDAFVAAMKSWPPLEAFAFNGYLGVDLFFVITGFLLTLPWFRHARAGLPAPAWRTFYFRRARRIVPAYYVQLVILFFVVLPLVYPRIWMESTPFVMGNLGAHFTFLHYTSPLTSSSMTVNGALWTLAIEVQYYLLLPMIAPLFVRWPWRSLLAAAVIAAGWRWLAWNDLDFLAAAYLKLGAKAGVTEKAVRHLIETQLPAWSLHFALGILAGRAWMMRRRTVSSGIAAWIPIAIAAGAVSGLGVILRYGTSTLGSLGWIIFPLLIATAFASVVSWPSPGLSRIVAAPPLAALGRISYSAYLYHLPALLLFNANLPGARGWLAFPLWFAVVILVSTASYRLVEAPYLLRWRG